MKAHLRSVRIAPKKANLVAKMVRGLPVPAALDSLEHTNKKAARLFEGVIRSAAANARQNDNQNPDDLIVKTVVVNKAITYHRGIPMARGRMRRIRKLLSHIDVTLGYEDVKEAKEMQSDKEAKKGTKGTSGTKGTKVTKETTTTTTKKAPAKKTSESASQKTKPTAKSSSSSAKTNKSSATKKDTA